MNDKATHIVYFKTHKFPTPNGLIEFKMHVVNGRKFYYFNSWSFVVKRK